MELDERPIDEKYSLEILKTWKTSTLGAWYLNSYIPAQQDETRRGLVERIIKVIQQRPTAERREVFVDIASHVALAELGGRTVERENLIGMLAHYYSEVLQGGLREQFYSKR